MISVPNRLQLSNGNKIIISLFILAMFFNSSCGLFQKGSRTTSPTVVVEPVIIDTITIEPDVKDTVTIVEKPLKIWNKKEVYKIAYILPFQMDNQELSTLISSEKITAFQPLASLEFYEGSLIALDSLKQQGANFEIFVYDNENDSALTRQLFEKEELKEMDLIIGPIFNRSLKPAVEFAQKNEIFLISPLSPIYSNPNCNPYFIMANSTISTQFKTLINFFQASDANSKIIL